MNQTDARSELRGHAARVSPLSAATLLLLVTMVLASSPAAPRAAFVHPADPRPVPTRTLTADTESDWVTPRRNARSEETQAAAAWWGAAVRVEVDLREVGRVAAPAGWVSVGGRMRPALLDLPPPARA
jgi:hypothetical protein